MTAGPVSRPAPDGTDPGPGSPVSLTQDRLLVLDRIMVHDRAQDEAMPYRVAVGLRVRGRFDDALFRASLRRVAMRHEVLRTVFRLDGPEPRQLVRPTAEIEVEQAGRLAAEQAESFLATVAGRPFDPFRGPLLRYGTAELADDDRVVVVAAHTLVADLRSLRLAVAEAARDYRLSLAGSAPDLGPPAARYAEHAARQRRARDSAEHRRHLDHWRETLRGAPRLTALPTDFPRPPMRSVRGRTETVRLRPAALARIEDLARSAGVSLPDVLLAAYGAFLGRISGQEDVVLGLAHAGRDAIDVQDMVGPLADTVPVRLDLSGAPDAATLLGRVAAAARAAAEHRDVSIGTVLAELAPAGGELSHDPVYQVALDLDLEPAAPPDLPGARVDPVDLPLGAAPGDLLLQVHREADGLRLALTYRSDLLLPATARRWVRNLLVLLESLPTAPPRIPAAAVPVVVGDERAELLAGWNDTATDVPPTPVHELLADRAERWGDRPAVGCRETVLAYRELSERSDRLAWVLRDRGVGVGTVVGLLLSRSVQMPVAVLAVLKAGGAYLPLDPGLPRTRLSFMVEDSAARVVVTERGLAGPAGELGVPTVVVDGADAAAIGAAADRGPCVASGVTGSDLAYVIYTSGSTGRPKGVAVEHHSLTNLAEAQAPEFGVTPEARILQFAAFSFDVSVSDMFFTWAKGAFVQIAAEDERLGPALYERLRKSRITSVTLPPAAVATLPWEPGALPDLRMLVVGGEAFAADLVEPWARDRTVVNAYGPTESTVWTTLAELRPGAPLVIGRPLANLQVYVLDRYLEPVPVGVVGELYVGGAGVVRGYLGRPELTAERFVPDPFAPPGRRLYRTGDLVRWRADGNLEFVGRDDGQVKVRGFRVELGEIEAALRGVPGVAQAVVMARRDGVGAQARLVAYVRAGDQAVRDAVLRSHLREHLPAYMVPEVYVRVDTFPTTTAGKVDRAALPPPPATRPETDQLYVPPRTDLEEALAGTWAAVLGVDRVGVHDDFFDLGGNSLRMLSVRNRLVRTVPAFGLRMADLYLHPTIAALAARLERSPEPVAAESQEGVAHGS